MILHDPCMVTARVARMRCVDHFSSCSWPKTEQYHSGSVACKRSHD